MITPLRHFTINQIDLLAQLGQTSGIRDLARKNSVDAASVSRLIKQAEEIFGFAIATRTKKGLILTSEGQEVVSKASAMMNHFTSFENFKSIDPSFAKIESYVFGSRGFLTTLTAGLVAKKSVEDLNFKLKFVDSSPQDLLKSALAGIVDIALHIEKWSWPSSWITQDVGNLTWGLVARQGHQIKSNCDLSEVQKYPFVGSSYLGGERVERSQDIFPLRWNQRRIGHESQTALTSKAIILASNHIAFLPLVTVEAEVAQKQIKVLAVRDMNPIQMKLKLSLHQDRVPQRVAKELHAALKALQKSDLALSKSLLADQDAVEPRSVDQISL